LTKIHLSQGKAEILLMYMKKAVPLSLVILAVLLVGLLIAGVFNQTNSSPASMASTPSSNVDTKTQTGPSTEASPSFVTPTSPPPGSIVVPDDFSTINQAVANASDGQTIFVRQGWYNESIIIDKPIWLIGENQTVIDAHSLGVDVIISHDNVNVTGFTMRNTPTPATGSWIEQMQGIGVSQQRSNIQILNSESCNIYSNNLTDGSIGISIENSSQNNVVNNNIYDNGYGIDIDSSTNTSIINNVFEGNGMGITIENLSTANTIINNTLSNENYAIYLNSASGNMLRNNMLIHNLRGFGVTGTQLSAFINTVDSSNKIDGKPIYYLIGESNQIVPSDAGCVVLVNSINMTIQNAVLPLSSNEIILVNTSNSILNANKLVNVDPALLSANYMPQPPLDILLYSCFNNQILNNQGSIWLNYSYSNTLTLNTGVMHLYGSNNNKIIGNKLTAVYFDPVDGAGISLQNSSDNIIKDNSISNNMGGPGVSISEASKNNIIKNNEIAKNVGGITISPTGHSGVGTTNSNDQNIPSYNLIIGNNVTGNQNQGI
jgi:parallel beta-helix repeat protein